MLLRIFHPRDLKLSSLHVAIWNLIAQYHLLSEPKISSIGVKDFNKHYEPTQEDTKQEVNT